MNTENLAHLDPVTLTALAKTAAEAAKAVRPNLEPGEYRVQGTLKVTLGATVKVFEDQEGVLTPQKARPWALVQALLEEVNTLREAAGMAGLDLQKVVALAEAVDADLEKKAQKEANKAMAALKEPTRSTRKGQVRVKGDFEVAEID